MRFFHKILLIAAVTLPAFGACAGQQQAPGARPSSSASPQWRAVTDGEKTQPKKYGEVTEAEPEYWVAKLADPEWRSRAIKRLEQFFEDAVTRNNADLRAAEVQSLAS